jgi:hypothetical protein
MGRIQTLFEKRWFDLTLRVVFSAGLVYLVYVVSLRAAAEWYFRQPSVTYIRKAIAWNPGNPEYHAGLARVLQQSLDGDLQEVIGLYEEAVRLSPYQASYWAELGSAYETAERFDDARRAYERAQMLFPNSPEINWQLGNFYIRIGESRLALPAFQKGLFGDPALRRPAFDLAWRAIGNANTILEEMIPPDTGIIFDYLNYLVDTGRMSEAVQAWSKLLALNLSFEPQLSFHYLNGLIGDKRVDDLVQAWAAMAERYPTIIRQRPYEENAIYNGSFEREIMNGGLDWRVIPTEAATVGIDGLTFFDGTQSLRIRFEGKHNLDYYHTYQFVPVKPNTLYRFLGYMRTDKITTDSGPRFQIFDAYDAKRLNLATEKLTGTTSWTPLHLEFRTGPETRLLMIRVGRYPSARIDSLISGTVWVDRLSLNSVGT